MDKYSGRNQTKPQNNDCIIFEMCFEKRALYKVATRPHVAQVIDRS